jgi:RNA polymerase sigma-70 factor, ECF subfamily
MLVAWEGLDGARAARAAGCSKAAFAVRLHRARSQLAGELASLEVSPVPSPEPRSLEVNS